MSRIFGIFKKNRKKEEGKTSAAVPADAPVVEIPKKAVKGSHIDPRLIVKTGKRGKTVFLRSPCVPECGGCDEKFFPTPPDQGKKYCKKYSFPEKMWKGLNPEGNPKTCLGRPKPKFGEEVEKKEKRNKPLNPLKASKRGVTQPQVSAATSSKESRKKKKESKNKIERRDSR